MYVSICFFPPKTFAPTRCVLNVMPRLSCLSHIPLTKHHSSCTLRRTKSIPTLTKQIYVDTLPSVDFIQSDV